MGRLKLLFVDIGLIALATLISLQLRENFSVSVSEFLGFLPYFLATVASALIVCSLFGLDRVVWRFANGQDNALLIAAMTAVVVGAVAADFAFNRLDGVARSLPFLQLIIGSVFLIGARALHKGLHRSRSHQKTSAKLFRVGQSDDADAVLLVGISRLTEAYLEAVAELAPGRVKIAGLVGHSGRHVGRLVASYPVLGAPRDIEEIIDSLEVQGVSVDKIVVATPLRSLSAEERQALLAVERSRDLRLRFLAEDLGFDAGDERSSLSSKALRAPLDLSFEISGPNSRGSLKGVTGK